MNRIVEAINETSAYLSNKSSGFKPRAGIVLGTGLGAMVSKIKIEYSIPYSEIPHFPQSTVEFHKGNLLFGHLGTVQVVVMQGRFHYYEGYSMQQITFPIRVMKALGVQELFLSNAAGGMNPGFKKGDLVVIDDHINLLPDNPLRGVNAPELGERFVDMSKPYDDSLISILNEKAIEKNISLKEGVYVSVMGPNLETRAEYRWLRNTGADMVGMSTVPEVIVANQIGLKCLAVSVITDECDPDNLKPVNIAEIIEVAGRADEKLSVLFAASIEVLV